MAIIPSYKVSMVDDVQEIEKAGPWSTKSNGELSVLFGIPFDYLSNKFLHYEQEELNRIGEDIRGLRSYTVQQLTPGSVGANEWHRIRNELVFIQKGSVRWTFEDIYGNRRDKIANNNTGFWIPPFILHTYEVLEPSTEILCIVNTVFDPNDKTTHDTYNSELFDVLKKNTQ